MSLSHCIHQTLNSKASTRFHSGGRSEERFSRNAETDLVCRLLLEKKKRLSLQWYGGGLHRVSATTRSSSSSLDLHPYSVICTLFFNDPATTEIYTLSLHDALPILIGRQPT